jgi:hypothetical protein
VPDTTSELKSLIEDRLRELDDEAARLNKGLLALDPDRPKQSGPAPGGLRRAASGKPRAGRGQRRAQFLEAVKANPGMKGSGIAREIGISLTQAYELAKALRKDGSIRKSGNGYRVKVGAGG